MRLPKQAPSLQWDVLPPPGTRPVDRKGRYLHWDELRYRNPPPGLTLDVWWNQVGLARRFRERRLERMSVSFQDHFWLCDLPAIQAALHQFDRKNIVKVIADGLGNDDAVVEYRVRQLIEEAISSSQIEGAKPTTREMARDMVREQRKPEDRSERMILNNWRAMSRVRELVQEDRPLEVADLQELHRILGEDALDVAGAEGVLRTESDHVEVSDLEGNVWHVPPSAEGITERLKALLEFAEQGDGEFLHPALIAIVSHFWLAYEHPFRDGNGRMARALYYWCMLRHGYELAEFLSISGPIDRRPRDYYMAFAHVETDPFDLTYFILHQLDVMKSALDDLVAHLRDRARRTQELAATIRAFSDLNHRQRALLTHAVRHPGDRITIEGHRTSHQVHYLTARADISDLVERKLLIDHGGRPKGFSLAPGAIGSRKR